MVAALATISARATILRWTPAAAPSRGCGPQPSLGLVDIGYIKATGNSVKINLPKTAMLPETEFEWKIPKWSNTLERHRARSVFPGLCSGHGTLLC